VAFRREHGVCWDWLGLGREVLGYGIQVSPL